MSSLSERKSLWIHQYDQLAEASIASICATAVQYAASDVVLKKVFDGTAIMGPAIDHDALAIDSLGTWRAQVAEAAAAGVQLFGWVNATHHDQAGLHAEVGETIVVDLEPYAQFWQDGPGDVATYLSGLRAGGVQNLFVSIDPRASAESALGVAGWAAAVDGLLPQLYWTDFQQPEAVVGPLIDQLVGYGVEVIPVLPWDGSAADMTSAWNYAVGKGSTGVSLWRMGVAGLDALRAFGGLALPSRAVSPLDDVASLKRELALTREKLAAIAAVLAS
ncbi:MAG: hypothetical protein ACYDCQ_08595 [Dehalococcoidia bacterium]